MGLDQAHARVVDVLVVLVVNVGMIVGERFMPMQVLMPFTKKEDDSESHQDSRCDLPEPKGFRKYERRDQRANEGRDGKNGGFACRAEAS